MDSNNKKLGDNIYGLAAIIVLGIVVVFLASKLISINANWLESFSRNGEINPTYKFTLLGLVSLIGLILLFVNRKNLPKSKNDQNPIGYIAIIVLFAAEWLFAGKSDDFFMSLIFFIPAILVVIIMRSKKKF
jgi:nitrate reductase gamma subunit